MLSTWSIIASACQGDRDTPAQEAEGLRDVVSTLSGRFPRNPPLYYEMRLARISDRLKDQPDDLEAYDDAGVACDRLNRGDEAIAWMTRKRALLETMPAGAAERRDHDYRYHANLGTFLVHRWVRAGADRGRLSEVEAARDEIGRAMAINPDAHFGREAYQLRFLEWLLVPPSAGWSELPNFLGVEDPAIHPGALTAEQARKAVEGIAGLVVLGNAWESVDIYNALKAVLVQDTVGFPADREGGRNSLAYFAWLRCQELVAQGKGTMLPDGPSGEVLASRIARPDFERSIDAEMLSPAYRSLRQEADAWQSARTEYMIERMRQGRHPDDDPDFWSEIHEVAAATLPALSPKDVFQQAIDRRLLRGKLIIGGAVAASVALVTSPFWLPRLRRRLRSKAVRSEPEF